MSKKKEWERVGERGKKIQTTITEK